VVKKKSTRKHQELVEAINEDDFSKIRPTTAAFGKFSSNPIIVVDEKIPKRKAKMPTQ
jgi:hypothetical protein